MNAHPILVTISAGTAAGLVTILRKNNCLHPDIEPWWTKPDTAKRTDADLWKGVLPQGASKKRVVQPHMTKVIKELAKVDTRLRMLDTHDKVSFFDRKPDIVICPANYASSLPAAWYIVAIGDVKGRRSGQDKFDDDEIGKVIFFLQDLLRARPDKTTATGFLTDSYIIQFFRVRIISKEQLNYKVDATRPYYLKRPADGTVWRRLAALSAAGGPSRAWRPHDGTFSGWLHRGHQALPRRGQQQRGVARQAQGA